MVHRGGPAVCTLAALGALRFLPEPPGGLGVGVRHRRVRTIVCILLAVDEITETRYGQQPINAAAHFGLIGWLVAAMARGNNKVIRSLELIGPHKIGLNSNIRDVAELVRLVLAAVNPRLRKDAERILNSGGTVSFGKISLSPGGVVWKSKEPIPYSALVKCKIDGSMLRVKAEGKWLDNIAITAKKVPNIFVLLDLIEEKRSTAAGKTAFAMASSTANQYL